MACVVQWRKAGYRQFYYQKIFYLHFFLTMGSPVIVYFFIAFWMNVKRYIMNGRRILYVTSNVICVFLLFNFYLANAIYLQPAYQDIRSNYFVASFFKSKANNGLVEERTGAIVLSNH
ncbi:MAG: hypothetical protein WDM71_06090 [Ferruginibacter sp.]